MNWVWESERKLVTDIQAPENGRKEDEEAAGWHELWI